MHTLYTTASLLARSLSWALLSSLWQGLLIFGAVVTVLKALPALSARGKYYLSYGAMSSMFIWFADTWVEYYQKIKGTVIYITQTGLETGVNTTLPITVSNSGGMQSPVLGGYIGYVEQYVPIIMLIYATGLLFMLIRFLMSVNGLMALKTRGLVLCNSQYADFVKEWQEHIGISRRVRLYLSSRIDVPMMMGALKPIILLPVATINQLSQEQVEAILLHELAHIKRHDYLLNILQTIIETILFFNPFVWLLSRIIRREREHCCDDMVVSLAASPLPYAHALTILETNRISDHSPCPGTSKNAFVQS